MKKLIAVLPMLCCCLALAQTKPPNYVGVSYDIRNGNFWPAAASDFVTNNPVIQSLLQMSNGPAAMTNFVHRTGDEMYGPLAVSNYMRVGIRADTNAPAPGRFAFEQGTGTKATGNNASARGLETEAPGENASASGQQTRASGRNAITFGLSTKAEGVNAVAGGQNTESTGENSLSFGRYNRATEVRTIALGSGANATNPGSFVWRGALSDGNSNVLYNSHGDGSFNVDPEGGLSNFWIGETNLLEAIESSGSGFPLAADADFNGYGAYGVRDLKFSGSTNLLAYDEEAEKLLYGGEPVGGTSFDTVTNGVPYMGTNGAFTNFLFTNGISLAGPRVVFPIDKNDPASYRDFNGLALFETVNYEPWLGLFSDSSLGIFGSTGRILINHSGVSIEGDTHVGGVRLGSSTNVLTADENGTLLFGGKPVSDGIANLTAGRLINLQTNYETRSVEVSVTNNASFSQLSVSGNSTLQDVVVRGDLSIYGTEYHNVTIHNTTNIYIGVQTNYVTTEIHTTNHQYQYLHIVERTTNFVDEVVNVGGNVDNSRANLVLTPSFRIDNSNTNLPVLHGYGTWDLSSANVTNFGQGFNPAVQSSLETVDLSSLSIGGVRLDAWPAGGVTSLNSMSGAVSVVSASPSLLSVSNSTNAYGTREVSLNVDLANAMFPISNKVSNLSSALTVVSNRVDDVPSNYLSLADWRTATQNIYTAIGNVSNVVVTNSAVITNSAAVIAEIKDAVSKLNPAIETPDGKRWKAVGVYSESGQPTFSWVEYSGDYWGTITLDMPDNRHFRMVGVYADGEVTHRWEEMVGE